MTVVCVDGERRKLTPGGKWLPGCTEGTESYIHPIYGVQATVTKGAVKAADKGQK
jgi:hypothetical protein